MAIPDAMLLALLQGLYSQLEVVLNALEEMKVSNQEQEAALNVKLDELAAAVEENQTQTAAALGYLAELKTLLENRTDVDLSQEIGRVDAAVTALKAGSASLDEAVPDAAPTPDEPPAEPVA